MRRGWAGVALGLGALGGSAAAEAPGVAELVVAGSRGAPRLATETAAPVDVLSRAYAIVPAVYSFKEKGVAMREEAQMTYVLRKGADGWKIQSWTWTGPRATPAK